MTMSCTWSTQLCPHPSGPHLPFTCMDRIMSCTWFNHSHSDYESRTPSYHGVATSLQPCLVLGQPNYAIIQVVLMLEDDFLSLVWIEYCLALGPINLIQIMTVGLHQTMGAQLLHDMSYAWSTQLCFIQVVLI